MKRIPLTAAQLQSWQRLTPRQREIVSAMREGDPTDRALAERFGLGLPTVHDHMQSALRTLKVGCRTQAALIAERVAQQEAP